MTPDNASNSSQATPDASRPAGTTAAQAGDVRAGVSADVPESSRERSARACTGAGADLGASGHDAPPSARVQLSLLRDCHGGERIVELILGRGLKVEDVEAVEGASKREIFNSLPRPFVRIDVPGRFTLTGIVGDPRVRFVIRSAARERARELALETARRWGCA